MAEWDGEGFEPGEIAEKKGDAWEGEDEDDNELKENWDDEEEGKDKPDETESPATTLVVKKKKSTVKQKILEKEEKRREEMLRRAEMKEQEEEEDYNDDDDEESILASKLAEKEKTQQLVEEADLEVTKDLFGGANVEGASKNIDTFEPSNKDEFNELGKMIAEKLSKFETSVEYPGFLEVLLRDLASAMEPNDMKNLASVLNGLASEKKKAQKAITGKKKAKNVKAVLGGNTKGTKGVDLEDYSTYGDLYDDFM